MPKLRKPSSSWNKNGVDNVWTFSKIWNDAVQRRESRAVEPRSVIWASELGKSDVDIYLKLLGEPPSNDFDARSIRKFEAGNLFEWIVKIILIRSGIYKESQKWILNDEFGLKVTGRLDHIAGGEVDIESAKSSLTELDLPSFFMRAADAILEYFKDNYNGKLQRQGIEVKSTSSYGIEKVYETNLCLAGHDLQAFHYAYNENLPFVVLYICRDDLRMAEIPVEPRNKELLEMYSAKINRIAEYYHKGEMPPIETEIVFEGGRFSKNFNVEYSAYLTKLYGYPSPKDYDEKVSPIVESWNRVVTRLKNGDKITDNNKEKIEAMMKAGFDIFELLEGKNENK